MYYKFIYCRYSVFFFLFIFIHTHIYLLGIVDGVVALLRTAIAIRYTE